jgi:hypothetical protein
LTPFVLTPPDAPRCTGRVKDAALFRAAAPEQRRATRKRDLPREHGEHGEEPRLDALVHRGIRVTSSFPSAITVAALLIFRRSVG